MSKPHSHYFRPCPFDEIDVYRVCDLFDVRDPCLMHALKKILLPGCRGSKSVRQDVQEAIDTLERWKQMRKEEDDKFGDDDPVMSERR